MAQTHSDIIAKELGLARRQIDATLSLISDGATIPFMARYRKEVTGSLDEVQLAAIRDRAEQLQALDKRREAILTSLQERNLLNEELKAAVTAAVSMSELEDIYLPYRPKRRTRATIAREKGLEPLALLLMEQKNDLEPDAAATHFIDTEKGVSTVEEALEGARDIIAEMINEDAHARAGMRDLFMRRGVISAKVLKGKEEEGAKYRDYFEWSESVAEIPSHRLLALRRGEKEEILSLGIRPEEADAQYLLERQFVTGGGLASDQVALAAQDCYERLMAPSMETEVRVLSKDKADGEAIRVFADNLRQLLLAAPLGEKTLMAVDPGFRTGCKVVCLDRQGKLLENTVIHPQSQPARATATVQDLVVRHQIEVIAVGNGTAGRETEAFLKEVGLPASIAIVMVNESGASIYSASEVAREEFPDQDVTVRGAVSIGRRLMDPLAELVKIDPKSIGVGQYQHDVDQQLLKKSLDDTVISCVNAVGVEVNTASKQLLTYVSGLGPSLAQNILEYRNANGPFRSRDQLKKVPRLGPKAFEQAAGFLRIRNAENPLDASAVHPESYPVVSQMAKDLGTDVSTLMSDEELRKKIDLKKYVTETVGLPTLQDIVQELAKPGRDPRQQFEVFSFAAGINSIEDLHEGMELPGIVTNVTDFGAFVDIGVHQDGLVHISQMANRRIAHPSEVVKVQQKVKVTVTAVDVPRKRISLSMKGTDSQRDVRPGRDERQQQPRKKEQDQPSEFIRFGKPQQKKR
ncbi:MAG: RNA-binding transcriptional accessory protein [Bacteroidetes bacterium]|nr:MAG: RNA-binding transcriptional accessory protein [Bacteroidota bacterium]